MSGTDFAIDPEIQEAIIDNAYKHITESFELALQAEDVDEDTIETVLGTVDDAVTNHYDSHLILTDDGVGLGQVDGTPYRQPQLDDFPIERES